MINYNRNAKKAQSVLMISQYKRKWAYVTDSWSIENKKHAPNFPPIRP